MKIAGIKDPIFLQAVEAIDNGNLEQLSQLINKNSNLITDRFVNGETGYFKDPFLLWFVADNPIRRHYMPDNIVEITSFLIDAASKKSPGNFQQQINYALGLTGTGMLPKESGKQIALMNLLINAGAKPGIGHSELAHGNKEAAKYLIERGGELTLTTALCLDLKPEVENLVAKATVTDKQIALMAVAFYGDAKKIAFLLKNGANVNGYLKASSGFHHHATALHQAVDSGSIEAVKLLLEAGADLDAKDKVYKGTALEWAQHLHTETSDEQMKEKYKAIEHLLLNEMNSRK